MKNTGLQISWHSNFAVLDKNEKLECFKSMYDTGFTKKFKSCLEDNMKCKLYLNIKFPKRLYMMKVIKIFQK